MDGWKEKIYMKTIDGWLDGWMDRNNRWMVGLIKNRWMVGWRAKKIYEKIYGWMDRKDRWMVGCIVNKL